MAAVDSKVSKLSLEEIGSQILQAALDPTKTAQLCELLRTAHAAKSSYDWKDAEGNTLFHLLAKTPGHEWSLIREAFQRYLPLTWRQGDASKPVERRVENLTDVFASFRAEAHAALEKVKASIVPPAIRMKNKKQETPLFIALCYQNLEFAKLAWEHKNALLEDIPYFSDQAIQAWMGIIPTYCATENSRKVLDWVIQSLQAECGSYDQMVMVLNQLFVPQATMRAIGELIQCSAAMSDEDKFDLYAYLEQKGVYERTDLEDSSYQYYQQRTKQSECLNAAKLALEYQAKKLAEDLVEQYGEAVKAYMSEMAKESPTGWFGGGVVNTGTLSVCQGMVERLRQQIVSYQTNPVFSDVKEWMASALENLDHTFQASNSPKLCLWEAEKQRLQASVAAQPAPVMTFQFDAASRASALPEQVASQENKMAPQYSYST